MTMSKTQEALKLALEALGYWHVRDKFDKQTSNAITAIREALAEQPARQEQGAKDDADIYEFWARNKEAEQPAQQQEPVLWQILNGVWHAGVRSTENRAKEAAAGMQKAHDLGGSLAAFHVRPLYTFPPASKPWVGLTPEQRATIAEANNMLVDDDLFDAIEAELKEKNNG